MAKVFDALFGNDGGVLRGGGTILVTHAVHFLPRAEVSKILVLSSVSQDSNSESETGGQGGGGSGNVIFNGTWAELVDAAAVEDPSNGAPLSDLLASALSPHGDGNETLEDENSATTKSTTTSKATKTGTTSEKSSGALITAEVREEGVANIKTWIGWVAAAGGPTFLATQITFLLLDRMAYAATEWWLAKWTEARDERVGIFGFAMPAQSEEGSAWEWSKVYFCIFAVGCVMVYARTQYGLAGGVRAAKVIYAKSQQRVIFAPMSYFDTTPLGRLLNRFSYDADVVDINMTMKANTALISVGWVVTGISVMAAVTKGVMLLLLFPVFAAVYHLQLFYRRSAVRDHRDTF
jgi:ABC-type multidrug transport system fused ATPase/permease subunit